MKNNSPGSVAAKEPLRLIADASGQNLRLTMVRTMFLDKQEFADVPAYQNLGGSLKLQFNNCWFAMTKIADAQHQETDRHIQGRINP